MKWVLSARHALGRAIAAWTRFWFTPLDPLSLGVCRVLVGGMMLYAHVVWGLNLEGFFGPDGWQSTEAVRSFFADDWLPSLWWYVPVEHLRLVHLLCLVPLVMFVFGLLTPVSSVLALAITISNSNRAPLANYGMDQILTVLALYLVIGGSGDRFSLDAWWRRRRGTRKSSTQWRVPATSRARLATRLIQVHFCIIYFFAGISKLQGDAWWNGEAVWMAFANQEYQSIDMTWLARFPWVTQIATHGTVLWELSFPFLIWNRVLRPYVLLIGVGMHAGIGLCMGMITFGLIAIFGYIAFVPPEVMQRVIDSGSGLFGKSQADRRRPVMIDAAGEAASIETAESGPMEASEEDEDEPVTALTEESPHNDRATPIAICDPGWGHRQFAHYLSRRGFSPCMSVAPGRLWCQVEQHDLCGVILFVDQLSSADYALLLNDLTLAPVSQLPLVIASRRRSRLDRAEGLRCPYLRGVLLPAACRELRMALQAVLKDSQTDVRRTIHNRESNHSQNGNVTASAGDVPYQTADFPLAKPLDAPP